MIRVDLDRARLTVLDGGRLWLDGGAMFGVVPRPLWERERAPDERNRIELAMNVLLIEDGSRRILVDNGAGDKWDDKSRKIYNFTAKTAEQILRPAGLAPEDVDIVLCSHLHFDHAGGSTRIDDGGSLVAAFPNAEYVMQRGEVEFARRDNERIRASYASDNFEPLLAEKGRVRLVDGDVALDATVSMRVAPGHTPFMQVVDVDGGNRKLTFLADLVPTASHVPFAWIMGYDVEPLATLATKKRVLPQAHRERRLLVFEHDAALPLGELIETDGRLRARPFEAE